MTIPTTSLTSRCHQDGAQRNFSPKVNDLVCAPLVALALLPPRLNCCFADVGRRGCCHQRHSFFALKNDRGGEVCPGTSCGAARRQR